jgi:hypothetical protein
VKFVFELFVGPIVIGVLCLVRAGPHMITAQTHGNRSPQLLGTFSVHFSRLMRANHSGLFESKVLRKDDIIRKRQQIRRANKGGSGAGKPSLPRAKKVSLTGVGSVPEISGLLQIVGQFLVFA